MSYSKKDHQKELTSASRHLEPQKYSDVSKDSRATVSCYQNPLSRGHVLCPPEKRVDLHLGVGVGC